MQKYETIPAMNPSVIDGRLRNGSICFEQFISTEHDWHLSEQIHNTDLGDIWYYAYLNCEDLIQYMYTEILMKWQFST